MILLTGATGFVGQALLKQLGREDYPVTVSSRRKWSSSNSQPIRHFFAEIKPDTEWYDALSGTDVVIHVAARVHVMHETSDDPLQAFREVNTLGTLNLARQAAESGVKRFIFLSSIKVNGESTLNGYPFTDKDHFIPTDPYALSKYEAEQGLKTLARKTGMEVVIIRPPLVYGPGVKANFEAMIKWVKRGIPLPFGNVFNKRSFIALENLVSFILLCINHPKAANETFLVSDNEDVSTTQLLQKVARSCDSKILLLPIPVPIMEFCARAIGKDEIARRLFGSLHVDCSKARDLLGWEPVITMAEQLEKTVDALSHEKAI